MPFNYDIPNPTEEIAEKLADRPSDISPVEYITQVASGIEPTTLAEAIRATLRDRESTFRDSGGEDPDTDYTTTLRKIANGRGIRAKDDPQLRALRDAFVTGSASLREIQGPREKVLSPREMAQAQFTELLAEWNQIPVTKTPVDEGEARLAATNIESLRLLYQAYQSLYRIPETKSGAIAWSRTDENISAKQFYEAELDAQIEVRDALKPVIKPILGEIATTMGEVTEQHPNTIERHLRVPYREGQDFGKDLEVLRAGYVALNSEPSSQSDKALKTLADHHGARGTFFRIYHAIHPLHTGDTVEGVPLKQFNTAMRNTALVIAFGPRVATPAAK